MSFNKVNKVRLGLSLLTLQCAARPSAQGAGAGGRHCKCWGRGTLGQRAVKRASRVSAESPRHLARKTPAIPRLTLTTTAAPCHGSLATAGSVPIVHRRMAGSV